MAEDVISVSNSSVYFPNHPKGILFNTTVSVKKETSDIEICQQLFFAIRENRNLVGKSSLKIIDNFDFCGK